MVQEAVLLTITDTEPKKEEEEKEKDGPEKGNGGKASNCNCSCNCNQNGSKGRYLEFIDLVVIKEYCSNRLLLISIFFYHVSS